MRTSRIARHTAQVVDALNSPRRNLRPVVGTSTSRPSTPPAQQTADSDSPLSTPPQTPQTDRKILVSSVHSSTRKRKRGTDTPDPSLDPSATIESSTLTATKTSPRKASTTEKPKKARRQPAKQIKGRDGKIKVEPPAAWEQMYNLTKEMRKEWQAPVDTMGCESLAEDRRTPRDRRFQTLVALMLSSQTKDTVTAVAMRNLQEHLPGGFTLQSMRKVEPSFLNNLIEKVGFHNNKTKYIKRAAEILAEQHGGDIPDTIEGLIALPGVGPKMAYLCMSAAWGKDEGIGVDVHVHRITNLWGWHKTKDPEETRAMLESWLPREKWHDINHLLVGFGQTWCPPVGRKCEQCRLSHEGLCPSAVVAKKVQKSVSKEQKATKDAAGEEVIHEQIKIGTLEEPVKAEQLDELNFAISASPTADIEDSIPHRRRSARQLKAH